MSVSAHAQFAIVTDTTNSPQTTATGDNTVSSGVVLTLNGSSGSATTVTVGGAHTFTNSGTTSTSRDADASGEVQTAVSVTGNNAIIVNNGTITATGNPLSGGGARTVMAIQITGSGLGLTNSGTISVTGTNVDETLQAILAGGSNMTFTNSGTISASGLGRAIDSANSALGTFTINNEAGGIISATSEDTIRVRGNTTVAITNSGTIYSGPNINGSPTSAIATGQALDLASATGAGGSVINTATGLIRADGHDAVRLGSNMAMTNYGTVRSNTVVNDSPANNAFNTPAGSTTETFSAGEGVSFENGSNSSLDNHGTISGARHGVESDVSATNITITNRATGQIIGRNGSGIGFDATNASATNVIIHNYGLVRGDYAGAGNIIDRTGSASLTNDGDGDGIDIDGSVTINNYATGQIISTGAAGFDTGGRANNSEAIAIGGGVIVNDGLIQGAGRGILVNNDSVISRSGSAAASITNNVGATIEGQSGFAIRLENKLGDARDNDTIINAGTVIGNGTIPDSEAIVLRQNGLFDPNSSGTLDGVVYTGTGSARFVRGDGSAIQTGEGDDVLTNTGTITGNTGLAINMEGGSDTVNFSTGTITGAIDGGAGTDTLNLGAGVSNGSAIKRVETIGVASGTATLSGVVSGTTLTKSGAGTLVLSADNTYTGGTTVSAGTLRVENSTGSATGAGNVAVASAATLAGGGIIGGNVTLDGILAPGNLVGTLTVNGTVTWNGDVSKAWQFDLSTGNTSDHLAVGGDFTKGLGSDFVFDFKGSSEAGVFTLAQWGGTTNFTSGDFTYVNLDAGYTASFAVLGNELQVTTAVVPEPAAYTAIFGAGVLGFALCRRRRRVR